MGWTSYHATHYKPSNGRLIIDRKAEIDNVFGEGYEIVKSTMVGSVHYAAVRKIKQYTEQDSGTYLYVDIPKEKQFVFATVTLTRTDMADYYNFAYKDMDESMGPCESNCPLSILKLLSPTDNRYAMAWRKRCGQNAEHKKRLSGLPIGSVIRFQCNGVQQEYIKHVPAFQFKRPFWYNPQKNTYIPASRIPLGLDIVHNAVEEFTIGI